MQHDVSSATTTRICTEGSTDVFATICFAIGAIFIMMVVESIAAVRQHRKAELGTVVLAGLLGMAYFIGVLYAAGLLA
jgi:hypothetical protein